MNYLLIPPYHGLSLFIPRQFYLSLLAVLRHLFQQISVSFKFIQDICERLKRLRRIGQKNLLAYFIIYSITLSTSIKANNTLANLKQSHKTMRIKPSL